MSKIKKRYVDLAKSKGIDIEGLWDNSLTEFLELVVIELNLF